MRAAGRQLAPGCSPAPRREWVRRARLRL